MRTVHEPDLSKSAAVPEPTPTNRKSIKLKLANGNKGVAAKVAEPSIASTEDLQLLQNTDPKAQHNNIRYVPAFHPVTGQAGFMIHYPADIVFTSRESDMAANELMRLLRRQLAWAEAEGADLKEHLEELERLKRHEWTQKEILLEGFMEAELTRAKKEGVFETINTRVRYAMEEDAVVGKGLSWTQGTPLWRGVAAAAPSREDVEMVDVGRRPREAAVSRRSVKSGPAAGEPADDVDDDKDPYDNILAGMMAEYEERERGRATAAAAAEPAEEMDDDDKDDDKDPYDNILAGMMAEYEERERMASMEHMARKKKKSASRKQRAAEVDAVGALMGMGMGH
jgi:hypothetical protein